MKLEMIGYDDRGYMYGDGLFETVKVAQNGNIRWYPEHVKRIAESGRALGFPETIIAEAIAALDAIQREAIPGLWRVTMTRPGEDVAYGGSGCVRVHHRERSAVENRPRLCLEKGYYFPDDSLAQYKTTSRIRLVEAKRRAMRRGFDEPLLVASNNLVGETTMANILVVVDGKVITPPINGILPGITRGGVLALAKAHQWIIHERDVDVDDIYNATEIVLLSSGTGIVAAASVDDRILDDVVSTQMQQWIK